MDELLKLLNSYQVFIGAVAVIGTNIFTYINNIKRVDERIKVLEEAQKSSSETIIKMNSDQTQKIQEVQESLDRTARKKELKEATRRVESTMKDHEDRLRLIEKSMEQIVALKITVEALKKSLDLITDKFWMRTGELTDALRTFEKK